MHSHYKRIITAIILHTMSVWIKISVSLLCSLNLLEYQCTSCRTKRLYSLWIAGSGSQPSFNSGNDSFLNNSEYLSGSEVWAPWPAKLRVYLAYNAAEVSYSQLCASQATSSNWFCHIMALCTDKAWASFHDGHIRSLSCTLTYIVTVTPSNVEIKY